MKTVVSALALAAALPCSAAPAARPAETEATLPPVAIASAPPVARGYAPVNGLRLYYEVHGPEGGTPIVLLHGGDPAIETSWERILPSLARTHRVIAFDQQGHGRTVDVDRPFTFEGSADDTAALLAYLNVAKADLVGFSNGANVAMQVAIRHPQVVRRLEMARLLPHARLAVLPLTDHEAVVMARADWFVPMVEAFLGAGEAHPGPTKR